jgi:hypothetical protein
MIADFKAACPGQAVPFFHLSPCFLSRTKESGRSFRSQALAIHVDCNKLCQLKALLKDAYKSENNPRFVALNWKSSTRMHTAMQWLRNQRPSPIVGLFLSMDGITKQQMISLCPILKRKNLQRAKEIKAKYRKLCFIRRDSTQQSGLASIQVPTDPQLDPKKCKDWTAIDTPKR